MATLDDIQAALESIDDAVYYGMASKVEETDPWNYTVFSRDNTSHKENLTGYSERFLVAVVRENYVPEGMYLDVIEAMAKIPGMKVDRSRDIEYLYTAKPGTRDVVEMMNVYFTKGRKP